MVVCGYDNKMGEGLRLLFEGVIAALERTADTDGISLRNAVGADLAEIPIVNARLSKSDGTEVRMCRGLNGMVLAVFEAIASETEDDESVGPRAAKHVDRFIELLSEAENHNEHIKTSLDVSYEERADRVGRWIVEHTTAGYDHHPAASD